MIGGSNWGLKLFWGDDDQFRWNNYDEEEENKVVECTHITMKK